MNKILNFIIGFLCGAIITTLGFIIYIKVSNQHIMKPNNDEMYKMKEDMKNPPEMPNGQMPVKPNQMR